MIISSIAEAIGRTPLLRVKLRNGEVSLFLKLETLNPSGSMKARMAANMLGELVKHHNLKAGARIVESSSGNTATALAMLSAIHGFSFTALMDGHASKDKVRSVRALGGKVELVSGRGGQLATAVRDQYAADLAKDSETYWTAQHDNAANADGYSQLADELIEDLGTGISMFVSAIGTGGSLCGTARKLKAVCPDITIVGVEPEGSIIFGGPGNEYHQSGTGTPDGASVGLVIDYDVIDHGRKVGDREAFSTCHYLAKKHGILVGGSTGGAVYEALKFAGQCAAGDSIVVIACDDGAKYLDTIFNDEWLENKGIQIFDLNERFSDVLR